MLPRKQLPHQSSVVFTLIDKFIRTLVYTESGPSGLAWIDAGSITTRKEVGRCVQTDIYAADDPRLVQSKGCYPASHRHHAGCGYADRSQWRIPVASDDIASRVEIGVELGKAIGSTGRPVCAILVLYGGSQRQRQQFGTVCIGNLEFAAHYFDTTLDRGRRGCSPRGYRRIHRIHRPQENISRRRR